MEIKVQDYVDAIEATNYQTFEETKTASAVKKTGLKKALQPVVAAVSEAVATGHLIQAQLVVTGKVTVTYRMETGIINLPFDNNKRVFQFFNDQEDTVPVKVYLITISEHLNQSGLRIDEMGTTDDLMTDETSLTDKILQQADEQWRFIEAHPEGIVPEKPAETPAKTTAKKAPAKKTAAKKAPAKKTTAKKTTTKKTTGKKTAAKKTPAKSAKKA